MKSLKPEVAQEQKLCQSGDRNDQCKQSPPDLKILAIFPQFIRLLHQPHIVQPPFLHMLKLSTANQNDMMTLGNPLRPLVRRQ